MFRNHFKIAWRNITRNSVYSLINVLGLALGICSCLIIYLVTSHELSYDKFHPDAARIYCIVGDVGGGAGDKVHFARLPMPLAPAARENMSGLDVVAGITPYAAAISIPNGKQTPKKFDASPEGATGITEPSWFNIFPYEWLVGNPATALNDPFTLVLTESKARLYFGSGPLNKMLGRVVVYEDSLFVRVSGIVKDWHKNTDLPYNAFISAATVHSSFLRNTLVADSWGPGDMSTLSFVKLAKDIKPAALNVQLAALIKRHAPPPIQLSLWLEPLTDIHFNAEIVETGIRTAHLPTLYALMGIAIFILLLAAINFINLSTAQSLQRAREVGVRKVMGSSRAGLVWQFLTETALLTVIATVLAVVAVSPVLTLFRAFLPPGLSFHPFQPDTLVFLFAVILVTSLLAGLYPARLLSAYLPALSLKGNAVYQGSEKWWLRKGLIVFQFVVSLVFIIGSIVIARQLNFTRHKDLGFTTDAIITVGTPWGDSLSKVSVTAEKIKPLPGVSGVALEWLPPIDQYPRGMSVKFKSINEKGTSVGQLDGNEDFIPLYHLKLLAGRNLQHSDSVREFVINASCSQIMGCRMPDAAIGKTIYWNDRPYPVVGVVADFHGSSLHESIRPLCIINRVEREGNIAVRLASKGQEANAVKATLARIEKAWKSIYPAATFHYSFLDESIAMLYEKDRQTAVLMNTATLITIFISCIGLFGLAMFSAERRAKEIGIRKVLGASVTNIALLLSKDFAGLITIAALIASPIAWYFMNRWLQDFAYRIDISWWIFAGAGLSALFIAMVTVSHQALRAALRNPVTSLRSE
jgi:putative ABC transport system permease protein